MLFLRLLENKSQSPTTCNVLIRRTIFAEIGGFEEQFRGMYEDQAFFAKVELRAPVYVAGLCWAKYRQHPNSCSAQADRTADYAAARLPLLTWLAGYLNQQQTATDSPAWRAVQHNSGFVGTQTCAG